MKATKTLSFAISFLFVLASFFITKQLAAESPIKVLCTAALIPDKYEMRKKEYIRGILRIPELGYPSYVVESCVAGPTFLDECSNNVFYSQTNNPRCRNKGVNEAVSMCASLKHFNFDDNDIILKVTGRYCFTSDLLFSIIKKNPHADMFIKQFEDGQVFCACFAMRYKYLKQMLLSFDYKKMEEQMINLEKAMANFVHKAIEHGIKVIKLDYLDLIGNNFGDGIIIAPSKW